MKSIFRYISGALLLVLVWSCFGLGIGMLGHNMLDSAHKQPYSDAHACCITADAAAGTQTDMGHHQSDPVIVGTQGVVAITAAVLLFFLLTFSAKLHDVSAAQYLRNWERRVVYFALYFLHIFRRGILHPKTW